MTLPSTLDPVKIYRDVDMGVICSSDLECQLFERKRQKEPRDVASIISGLSNTNKEGGLIIIGVEDNGEIKGLSHLTQTWVNSFQTNLAQQIHEPVYEFKQHMVTDKDGQPNVIFLILVNYSSDKLIERSDGKAFRRVGDQTQELDDEKKVEFKFAKGQLHYEEKSFTNFSTDDYDKGVLEQFFDGIKQRDGIAVSSNPEQALRSKGFLQVNGETKKHTTVGVLSLMKNPCQHIPGAKIRFVKFDGREERSGQELNIVKDEMFEGPLPLLISKTFEFIKTQTKEFSYLDADGRFVKEPEYPATVILEAIVNAVFHRSYSLTNANI
ncbi:MAG: putative DNA binding domain-containing protein, partial [Nanoarchaeota archaeon]|nr:putative DNA binding domain-containing protein [Nanoarchaeota archaeon]